MALLDLAKLEALRPVLQELGASLPPAKPSLRPNSSARRCQRSKSSDWLASHSNVRCPLTSAAPASSEAT